MLWFFEKQRTRLRFEIRRDTNGPAYELVITYSDGRQEVERFPDTASVVERSRHLQNRLTREGWQTPATKFGSRPRT